MRAGPGSRRYSWRRASSSASDAGRQTKIRRRGESPRPVGFSGPVIAMLETTLLAAVNLATSRQRREGSFSSRGADGLRPGL